MRAARCWRCRRRRPRAACIAASPSVAHPLAAPPAACASSAKRAAAEQLETLAQCTPPPSSPSDGDGATRAFGGGPASPGPTGGTYGARGRRAEMHAARVSPRGAAHAPALRPKAGSGWPRELFRRASHARGAPMGHGDGLARRGVAPGRAVVEISAFGGCTGSLSAPLDCAEKKVKKMKKSENCHVRKPAPSIEQAHLLSNTRRSRRSTLSPYVSCKH